MKRITAPFSRLLLSCISWPLFSRLWGKLMRLRYPRFLAKRMIEGFKNHYQIDMDEFVGTPQDYPSLADFFVRPLDPQKKPLPTDDEFILSPADGKLSALELISTDCATQVKGKTYLLSRFLAAEIDFSQGWYLATIYLSPCNYHRFHYPVSGLISGCFHGGNRLFPVNEFSCSRVRKLYIKNERLITRLDISAGPLYVAAVGATFVGSIAMTCLPDGLPAKNEWRELAVPVNQMAEMGRFNMGSTIIMAFPAAMVKSVVVEKGKPLRVGDPMFKISLRADQR
jgi:phosphatidylserine decarboxylase